MKVTLFTIRLFSLSILCFACSNPGGPDEQTLKEREQQQARGREKFNKIYKAGKPYLGDSVTACLPLDSAEGFTCDSGSIILVNDFEFEMLHSGFGGLDVYIGKAGLYLDPTPTAQHFDFALKKTKMENFSMQEKALRQLENFKYLILAKQTHLLEPQITGYQNTDSSKSIGPIKMLTKQYGFVSGELTADCYLIDIETGTCIGTLSVRAVNSPSRNSYAMDQRNEESRMERLQETMIYDLGENAGKALWAELRRYFR